MPPGQHGCPVSPHATQPTPSHSRPGPHKAPAATHIPLTQQPLEQAVWLASPQAVSQTVVTVLHARPAEQSDAAPQPPHAPLMHRCPCKLAVQSTQRAPVEPHCACATPKTQLPFTAREQQPPWHGWAASHRESHWFALGSHAQ
jgi:hypothetical protein